MNMIGVGIIGFGYMGYFHLNRIKNMNGMKVMGIYDLEEKQKQFAVSEHGLISYETVDDMLNDCDIQLIIVSTPNDSHYEYSMKAIAAGKNVLCEKPAMLSVEELKAVLKAAEKHGVFFTTHQNRRWDKDFDVVMKVVNDKLIGGVTTVYSETHGQRGVCFGWRADSQKGGGMLYDWGVHLIDQLLCLFGGKKVISIYARLRSILTPSVDDYFEIELEFEGDIVAHISVGTFALQDRPRWFVFGDKGTLKIDDFSGVKGGIAKIKDNVRSFPRVTKNTSLGPSRTMAHLERENFEDITLPKPEDRQMEFYRNLEASLRGEETPYVTPEDMVRDLAIIEKVFESSEKGERLEVCI